MSNQEARNDFLKRSVSMYRCTNSFVIKCNLNSNNIGPSDCQTLKRLVIPSVSSDYEQV